MANSWYNTSIYILNILTVYTDMQQLFHPVVNLEGFFGRCRARPYKHAKLCQRFNWFILYFIASSFKRTKIYRQSQAFFHRFKNTSHCPFILLCWCLVFGPLQVILGVGGLYFLTISFHHSVPTWAWLINR